MSNTCHRCSRLPCDPHEVSADRTLLFDQRMRIIVFAPACKRLKLSQICGQFMADIVLPVHRSLMEDCCRAVLDEGQTVKIALPGRFTRTLWQMSIAPIMLSDGNVVGLCHSRATCPLAEELSPQQRRVLALLGENCSVKEIASHLRLTANTIRTHIRRAEELLQSADLHELLLWIARNQHALGSSPA